MVDKLQRMKATTSIIEQNWPPHTLLKKEPTFGETMRLKSDNKAIKRSAYNHTQNHIAAIQLPNLFMVDAIIYSHFQQ